MTRAAQSDEDKAAAMRAALEEAKANPEVDGRSVWGDACVLLRELGCTSVRRVQGKQSGHRRRRCRLQPPPCPVLLSSPLLLCTTHQMAGKMKMMEEAMSNPAMQQQMGQMM